MVQEAGWGAGRCQPIMKTLTGRLRMMGHGEPGKGVSTRVAQPATEFRGSLVAAVSSQLGFGMQGEEPT